MEMNRFIIRIRNWERTKNRYRNRTARNQKHI